MRPRKSSSVKTNVPGDAGRERVRDILKESITALATVLYDDKLVERIEEAARILVAALKKGNKILVCGNGGSAADSQHFAAELTGRFERERRALAAVALTTDTSSLTALANDYGYDVVFERPLAALGRRGDVLLVLSTSGRSPSVLKAVQRARKMGISTIGLTGKDGGTLRRSAELALVMPAANTARIQECHSVVIHILCAIVERAFSR
ncbi:MAG: SIS domain-containing protein [Deltaproteobacteria bacterium]